MRVLWKLLFSLIKKRAIQIKIKPIMIVSFLPILPFIMKPAFYMIQDKAIMDLRQELIPYINKLPISTNINGQMYQISFEFDSSKTDLFSLVVSYIQCYSKQDKDFKIVKIDPLFIQKDNIISIQIQFVQKDSNKQSKGSVFLSGTNGSTFKFTLQKKKLLTKLDIKAIKNIIKLVLNPKPIVIGLPKRVQNNMQNQSHNSIIKNLNDKGVTVYLPGQVNDGLDFNCLGGYDQQKRQIQDTIFMSLKNPQVYQKILLQTRVRAQTFKPRALLLQGPPGTGKTTTAKIVAQQAGIPLVYVPIQSIVSKWYGQGQKNMSQIWQLSKSLGKVIIFFDQIDGIGKNRDLGTHEAGDRMLSVLLRKLDGFQSSSDILLLAATNRKSTLDPALKSRMDLSLKFNLPTFQERILIIKRYAKQLSVQQNKRLAKETSGFSGRDISDLCKYTQRRWASKLIRKQIEKQLPDIQQYIKGVQVKEQINKI